MSLEISILTVIIPKIVLTEKFYCAINEFFKQIANQTFQKDNALVGVSFSDLAGIKNFIAVLVKHGLEHNTMESKDFVYINLYLGNFWTVDWLDRDWYHCWTKDSLPTHTNLYKSAFKKHVILDEVY